MILKKGYMKLSISFGSVFCFFTMDFILTQQIFYATKA